MNSRLRVLHITPDSKFFDNVFSCWENHKDIENQAIFIARSRKYQFKYIKNTDRVELLWNRKMVKMRLFADDYDVIIFHSLPAKWYKFVKYIPTDRIIIWWGWGYDIYQSQKGLPPMVNLPLYKPYTQRFVDHVPLMRKLQNVYLAIQRALWSRRRRDAISRVDYFQPVVLKEYSMMCQNEFFRAKEFYYKPLGRSLEIRDMVASTGHILLGNSATPTNNHLDVLEVVKACKQDSQKIIIPLSYGNKRYTEWLKPQIQGDDIMPLYDFLPRDEYFKIVEGCSYAVIGTIRQQAMGNISFALSKGIKVFLYKDSVAYQNHKELGYAIYAIEDMTPESLSTPLSLEEMEQNRQVVLKQWKRKQGVFDACIEEIKRNKGLVDL